MDAPQLGVRWPARYATVLADDRGSGGNQQKLVVGRELDGEPKLLVVVQPTRGLGVAAVQAVRARLVAEKALREAHVAAFVRALRDQVTGSACAGWVGAATNASAWTTASRRATVARSSRSGFEAASCADIDECLTANGGCDQLTTCTNTAGSRTCSACPAGYAGTGATS